MALTEIATIDTEREYAVSALTQTECSNTLVRPNPITRAVV